MHRNKLPDRFSKARNDHLAKIPTIGHDEPPELSECSLNSCSLLLVRRHHIVQHQSSWSSNAVPSGHSKLCP